MVHKHHGISLKMSLSVLIEDWMESKLFAKCGVSALGLLSFRIQPSCIWEPKGLLKVHGQEKSTTMKN